MSSVKLMQAFTKEEEEYQPLHGGHAPASAPRLRLYSWQTLYSGAVNGLIAVGTALVVYVGARSVLAGAMSLGELVVFIAYLAQLYAPVNQITQSSGLIAGARIGAKRCFEILDTEQDLKDGTRDFPAWGARGEVEWRGVSSATGRDAGAARGSISRSRPA